MSRFDLALDRRLVLASFHTVRAAGMELAPGRGIGGGRDRPLQHDPVHLRRRIGHRDRREQRLGVRMQRVLEDVLGRAVFDETAEVHNAHRVRDMLDDRQVVRDEQVGQLVLLLQFLQQVDDLRLDRHVERRDRLVADDEFGVERQRPRDADTLSLTARELVRIAVLVEGLQTAVVHDLVDIVLVLFLRHDLVLADRFADDLADREPGRERRERILEDDLHLGPEGTQFFTGKIVDFAAVEQHLSAGLFARETQDGASGGGLAAARFPDQPHRGPALQIEGDAVDRLDVADRPGDEAALDGEVLFQRVDLQDILRIGFHGGKVVFDLEFHFVPSSPS